MLLVGSFRRGRIGPIGLALGLVAAVAAASANGAAAQDSARVAVTGAVQVTANPNPVRAHSSPTMALNRDTGHLAIVESDVRGAERRCSVHLSFDGGRSWGAGGDLMVEPFTDCGFFAEYGPYATAIYGPDGTLFVAFVASEVLSRVRNDIPRHVFLARSTDSGRSFETTMVFEAPDGNRDRGLNKGPMLAVDPEDASRVYVGWRQGVFSPNATEKLKSVIAPSEDGGVSFGPPVDLTDERGGDYPAIAVDGDGVVHAVYWTRTGLPNSTPTGADAPLRPIMYARSTDRGQTFSPAAPADPGSQAASRPPVLVADPASGTLYLAWHGHAESRNTVPGFSGDLDVFVRTSTDSGQTWGERVRVNDDDGGANQFEPGISVAPGGRLDVAWYDFRLSPGDPRSTTGHSGDFGLSDVFYSSSSDRGSTFTPNVRVSDRSIDRSLGVWSNNIDSKFNVAIASTNDTVFVAWQDSRNALGDTGAEDVYTASVVLGSPRPLVASSAGSRVPGWLLVSVGVALGLGGAGAAAWVAAARRSGQASEARPSWVRQG